MTLPAARLTARTLLLACALCLGFAAPAAACRCVPYSPEIGKQAYDDAFLIAKLEIQQDLSDPLASVEPTTKFAARVIYRYKGMSRPYITFYDRDDSCGNVFYEDLVVTVAIARARNGDYIAMDSCAQDFAAQHLGIDPLALDEQDDFSRDMGDLLLEE